MTDNGKDMTAFIARNATESIGFIKTQSDSALTDWSVALSREYISIPTDVYELGGYVFFQVRMNSS